MKKKIQKKFFVFEIIVSELVPLNSLYEADNASHQLTLLGFFVSLKEAFSNGTTFTVINRYCKGASIEITAVLRPIFLVICIMVL